MFVDSNKFSAVRRYYSDELSSIYSLSELKLMLKFLFLKRFEATSGEYILADDKRLSESDLLFFHEALKRLKNREPFQHIVGEVEFYGLLLKSDERALIPRPETEELVDWILQSHEDATRIMDICAGSGCIALGLKSKLPEAKMYALEYSEKALSLMLENVDFTGLQIETLIADALTVDYTSLVNDSLDLIVSNPPYIPECDRSRMEANVLNFEPEMALFVEDDDPLIFYREIIRKSKGILKENGWLYFEIHEDLAEDVKRLFEQSNFVNIELRKDLQGKDRMMRGQVVTCSP